VAGARLRTRGGAVIGNVLTDFVRRSADPDQALMLATGALIEGAAVRHALDPARHAWRPGEPLRLLLAGYQGTRNTGADVRVEEMIRQLRTILGDDHVALAVLTIDPALSAGYFRAVRQIRLPAVFPKFLFDEVPRHHGVVACEGSMFKSKFANALTTMMAGSLGLAAVEGKLAVGYGAEAGAMDPPLRNFVRKHCRHALVVCRNEPSRQVLEGIGIRTRPGTDTAWTFAPAPPARGRAILERAGWDGHAPLLLCCPINPFWWPAKPDLLKAVARGATGQLKDEHYKSIYFHTWSDDARKRYDAYVEGLATALSAFARESGATVALVAMERLDRRACDAVRERMGADVPILGSDEHDMYDLVSVLRQASFLVSSRYHAIVTSMPGGVPSLGVTMDERIENLLRDRGDPDLVHRVDDDDLGARVLDGLRRLRSQADVVRDRVQRFVPGELRKLGAMGMDFVDEVARVYPDFPRREVVRSWDRYLPPLSAELTRLLEAYA
jgi:polysaccharide pyruvyl transferase WcaK-like protein